MTLDLQFVAAVVGAGMLCGMLNTLVSSGSAISLPTLMFIGLSPTMANGTNRLAIVVGAATALLAFQRQRLVQWYPTLRLGVPCVLGSLVGARAASIVDPARLQWMVVAALIVAIGVLLSNPKRLVQDGPTTRQPRIRVQHYMLFFLIGVWAGFLVLDSGTHLLLALVVSVGFSIAAANAAKSVLLLGIGVSSMLVFATTGEVDWTCGLLLCVGSGIGGGLAGTLASRHWVRTWTPRLVILIVALELARLVVGSLLSPEHASIMRSVME